MYPVWYDNLSELVFASIKPTVVIKFLISKSCTLCIRTTKTVKKVLVPDFLLEVCLQKFLKKYSKVFTSSLTLMIASSNSQHHQNILFLYHTFSQTVQLYDLLEKKVRFHFIDCGNVYFSWSQTLYFSSFKLCVGVSF